MRFPWTTLGASLALFTATPAEAGRGKPCDSCESCTALLAEPGAEVAVSGPIEADGTCITITGQGATFDGSRELIRGGTAVAIEADDVVVRHLRASAGERAVHITGARATLLDVRINGGEVGVHVERAHAMRLVRSRIENVGIGISFDAAPSPTCAADDRQHSPGAVLQRVTITGAKVGIAACEATPVVIDSTISSNGVGWVQGPAPVPENVRMKASGFYDPCVCEPTLDGVAPGTTLLYSSGCSGSVYHEGLLPEVRAQGHDINLRTYGRENAAASAVYDAYVRRCAPEITDAIGIPGCMPNYACVANGEVSKRRGDTDQLEVEHRLNSADDVAQFAARCVSAAAAQFGDGACQTHGMRGTTLCHNDTDLKASRPISGSGNTCDGIDGMDCTPCGATPAATPTAPAPTPTPAAPTPTAPAAPAPTAAPVAVPVGVAPVEATAGEPAPSAPTPSRSFWWLPLIALPLGAGLGVLIARR